MKKAEGSKISVPAEARRAGCEDLSHAENPRNDAEGDACSPTGRCGVYSVRIRAGARGTNAHRTAAIYQLRYSSSLFANADSKRVANASRTEKRNPYSLFAVHAR